MSFPIPEWEHGHLVTLAGLALGIAAAWLYRRWARAAFERTGIARPMFWPAVAIVDRRRAARVGRRRRAHGAGAAGAQRPQRVRRRRGDAGVPRGDHRAHRSTPPRSSPRSSARASSRCPGDRRRPRARSACRAAQALKLVLLPQALRVIIPPLTNQYLNLTKNSSLAVAIGYPDLVSIANTTLNQTGRAVECIAIIMAVYLTLSLAHRGADELVQRAVRDPRALTRRHGHRPSPSVISRPPPAAQRRPARLAARATCSPTGRARWPRCSSARWSCAGCRDLFEWAVVRAVTAPGQRRVPRARTCGRVLGRHRREVPPDPVRPLSVRRAVAPAGRHAADGGDAGGELHARVVEPLAGRGLGRGADRSSSC